MITFQDFEELYEKDPNDAITRVIDDWTSGKIYKTAVLADTYDRQENDTIMNFVKTILSVSGVKMKDFTASNNKIASNFFRRLNVQRNTYSLGNGIRFNKEKAESDIIKLKFGKGFDNSMFWSGYYALIHGLSFPYHIGGNTKYFKATEFAPLWDEETGVMRGGIRFWQIDADKPAFAEVYTKEGSRKYRKHKDDGNIYKPLTENIVPYGVKITRTEVGGIEKIEPFNYSELPIVPFWGSTLHQSTLIGLRSQIDSYDLVRSGFANDLSDIAQIFWIIENYGGMNDADLAKFRERLLINHIAEADTSEGGKITPYTQEIPFQARQAFLNHIRDEMYEGFGALDVHAVQAGSTNDHIDAAYQPLDENADDFEYQVISCVEKLAKIVGVGEVTPIFKRNRITNMTETVQMLVMLADILDVETIIDHIPFISVDDKKAVLDRINAESYNRLEDTTITGSEE